MTENSTRYLTPRQVHTLAMDIAQELPPRLLRKLEELVEAALPRRRIEDRIMVAMATANALGDPGTVIFDIAPRTVTFGDVLGQRTTGWSCVLTYKINGIVGGAAGYFGDWPPEQCMAVLCVLLEESYIPEMINRRYGLSLWDGYTRGEGATT